ncbi:MAG TPA: polysaccharide deacetylase [Gammaproteobacteria bacterium]|nr:polysaccharide deacetylase [Gammaproteobacteria bacterium]
MKPGDRLPYSGIDERKPLKLPGGARMIIWPVLALEVWDITRPMARMVIPPPQGIPMIPDAPNWSWHEYGMRVGFWRVKRMLDELGVRPTVTLNARTCLEYPRVAKACLDNGWELNAHAYEQIPMHKLEDEKASIRKTMKVITSFSGRAPRGWFGPGLTQTYDTIDYLAEAGIEYIGDWVLDDQPVWVTTASKPIVALPYNYEIHDIVLMAIQNHCSEVFLQRALDYFETIYAESHETTKVMAVAMHPYLSGAAHRIKYVRETFEHILSQPDVVCWDGEQILDWFIKERPPS